MAIQQVPQLKRKTALERGPIDPESLTAALKWDVVMDPAVPVDPTAGVTLQRPLEGKAQVFDLVIPILEAGLEPAGALGDQGIHMDKALELVKAMVAKGSGSSGNWGHEGRPGVRGGSAAGGGLGAIGVGAGASPGEKKEVVGARKAAREDGKDAPKGQGVPYKPDPGTLKVVRKHVLDDIENAQDIAIDHGDMKKKDRKPALAVAHDTVETLQAHVDKTDVAIRARLKAAEAILDEGRFKTQFETGTSEGAFDLSRRTTSEHAGMGVPEDIDPAKRPVYGHFPFENTSGVHLYGDIEFVLKPSVKARTTLTVADSLFPMRMKEVAGTPATDLGIESLDQVNKFTMGREVKDYYAIGYLEAQVHGGVTVKDVAKIVLHGYTKNQIPETLRTKAIKLGIEVEADPHGK